MFRPIYVPKGPAKKYCDLAINIYSGCNHLCNYCFARKMFERYHPGENFSDVKIRPGISAATEKQLASGKYKGETIQLCFTCDPYPAEIDTTSTREIIQLIKEAGAHVQILTKGGDRARRDFDLLNSGDSFGITLSCFDEMAKKAEPNAAPPFERIESLREAAKLKIKTWVSFDPVLSPTEVIWYICQLPKMVSKDILLRIGKLNRVANNTNWKMFGYKAEQICYENGLNYYIKEDLRVEMNREVPK